jgi:hypothetical protein
LLRSGCLAVTRKLSVSCAFFVRRFISHLSRALIVFLWLDCYYWSLPLRGTSEDILARPFPAYNGLWIHSFWKLRIPRASYRDGYAYWDCVTLLRKLGISQWHWRSRWKSGCQAIVMSIMCLSLWVFILRFFHIETTRWISTVSFTHPLQFSWYIFHGEIRWIGEYYRWGLLSWFYFLQFCWFADGSEAVLLFGQIKQSRWGYIRYLIGIQRNHLIL